MLVGEGFLWNVLEARGLLNGGRAGLYHGRSSAMSSLFLSSKNSSRDISPSWEENVIIVGCLLGRLYSLQGLNQVLLLVHLLSKYADICTISVMSH